MTALVSGDRGSAAEPPWGTPPGELSLGGADVHVWRASLRPPRSRVEELRRTLAPDELVRAAAFRFPRDRDAFALARGLLRTLLGGYLGVPPGALRFAYTRYGKPYVEGPPGAGSLCFNLSHAHDIVLYAFARGRKVGVDVEYLRREFACDEIARRFFSPRELEALRAVPPERRTEAFFDRWTRKEAFVKAVGEGLSFPLDRFEVSLEPRATAALLAVRAAAALEAAVGQHPCPMVSALWTSSAH